MSQDHVEKMKQMKKQHREAVAARSEHRGIVLVNTGDGKGKSSAAFGVAIRAAGHGQQVGLVQFIKGAWKTGEQEAIKRFPEIEHVVSGEGFTWDTQDKQRDIEAAEAGWAAAMRMMEAARQDPDACRVLILDEINVALSYGYLDVQQVVTALQGKPRELSVVLTGRGAPAELIEAADTVTEMSVVKHAWNAGVRARKGVEF